MGLVQLLELNFAITHAVQTTIIAGERVGNTSGKHSGLNLDKRLMVHSPFFTRIDYSQQPVG